MWRDTSVASPHGMLSTAPNLEMYGRALLSVEGNHHASDLGFLEKNDDAWS
jgi:hypothetical protein